MMMMNDDDLPHRVHTGHTDFSDIEIDIPTAVCFADLLHVMKAFWLIFVINPVATGALVVILATFLAVNHIHVRGR